MKEPRVKDLLAELEVRPTKRRGQNFVIDPEVTASIVRFGAPRPGDAVVEIGPGLGALTKELAQHKPLHLIEIEARFCEQLEQRFPEANIINSDVREVDLATLGDNLVVFGNLPYAFSTDIIFHLIANSAHISRAILLLQKEFVERLAAEPGTKAYGTVSVACQLECDLRLGPIFSGRCFHPPAKVDSQVIEFRFLKQPRYPVSNMLWLKRVIKAGFTERRKKLHNSLRASTLFSTPEIEEALAKCQIDGSRRAETLSVEEFVKLAEALPGQRLE